MELMIVLAIIAILTSVGVPAYQSYTTRAKFAEVFSLSAPAQLAMAEYQQTTGEWPTDNQQAGLTPPEDIAGNYVSGVMVQNNQIITTFKDDAGSGIAGHSTVLAAELGNAGQIIWDCYSLTIEPEYLPSNCR
jgi:type IV pilus assembly protein PilA